MIFLLVAALIAATAAAILGVQSPFATPQAQSAAVAAPLVSALDPALTPLPTNLGQYVVNNPAAIELGKALFWDEQAGSDGKTACATCHFAAGADRRSVNTLNPGKDDAGVSLSVASGPFAANAALTPADFPMGDHVVGSQGVVPATFGSVSGGVETSPLVTTPDAVFTDVLGATEIQEIPVVLPGAPFTLSYDGQTTDPLVKLSQTASAGEIETALTNLPNIGAGGVAVSGGPIGTAPVDIQFIGATVVGRNVPMITGSDSAFQDATPAHNNLIFEKTQGGPTADHNVRRVTGRNTPSVINAVFNDRNFWDGRAQNHFNGVNPFAQRDTSPTAAWRKAIATSASPGGPLAPGPVPTGDLNNASLASQAVGPPGNPVEMSADGRGLRDIGKKLLAATIKPLGGQIVAPTDSVLGPVATPGGTGLTTDYRTLVKAAFAPRLWQGTGKLDGSGAAVAGPVGDEDTLPANTYSQMQYNWPLFWGLAINMYESTLVSDQTPFDNFERGNTTALTASQQAGLDVFTQKPPLGGNCAGCHGGAELTRAAVAAVGVNTVAVDNRGNCSDTGFMNIGIRPTLSDVGNSGNDPFGHTLSDAVANTPPNCTNVQAMGSFKIPGLRNAGLTAPYFHSGKELTLEDVVAFYNRGGDFANAPFKNREILPLGLTATQQTQLVDFLRNGLTDPRVQSQSAPFDHPSLSPANGAPLPAVGAAGSGLPLAQAFPTFLNQLAPSPNPPVPPVVPPVGTPTPKVTFSMSFVRKIRAAIVRRRGFTITVSVPAGTAKVRVHLLKITRKGQLLLASFDQVVTGVNGTITITIPARRLRRITPGSYIAAVTQVGPGNITLNTLRRRLTFTK